MPVTSDNLLQGPRARLRWLADHVPGPAAPWPEGVDVPTDRVREDLATVPGKLTVGAQRGTASLTRPEREALWWLAYAMLSADLDPEGHWAWLHDRMWVE